MRICGILIVFVCVIPFTTTLKGESYSLVIDTTFASKEIGLYVKYLNNVSPQCDIQEIVKRYAHNEFKKSTTPNPSFGYSHNAVWVSLTVTNATTSEITWYLEYDYPIIDKINLYVPSGSGYVSYQTGDRFPFSTRLIPYRSFVFPITQKPGTATYFMRIMSEGSLVVPLKAWSIDAFERMRNTTMPLIWMHYGIMIALLLYNIFLFLSVHEKSFLYVSHFIIGVMLFAMANNGIAAQYLWPNNTWWGNICHPFLVFFAMIGNLLFTREFLSIKYLFRRLNIFLTLLIWVTVIFSIFPFVVPYYYATQLSVISAGIISIILIGVGVYAQIQNVREAKFYNLAVFSFVTGVLLISLRSFGLLGDNFFTAWGYQLGSAAMIILFSLGIADKVNTWRIEKERAMARLAISEAKYRTLVENAHDGIILVQDWKIAYTNDAFARMLGYTTHELLGIHLSVLIADTPLGQEVLQQYSNRIENKDAKLQYEAQLKRKSGAIIDVLISAQMVRLDGILTSVAIITDISALKSAYDTIQHQYEEIQSQYEELEAMNEEMVRTHYELTEATHNLEEEKERLQATLRSIYDAVIATDLNGNIIIMNEQAEKLAGKLTGDIVGKHFCDIFPLHHMTSKEPFNNPVHEILQHGVLDTSGVPLVIKTNDKDTMVELSGAPIYVEGNIIGTVIVLHDITDQYWLEKEIHKISKLESLSILAGGIAHDFNNLLTAIIGNISILKAKMKDNELFTKYIDRIEKAAQRATDLTRQLLTFSKGGDPIKEVASLEQILYDTAHFTLSGSNVRCEFDIEQDLWMSEIDSGQMSQVFHNLMINAMQSMPKGGVITVTAHNIIHNGQMPVPILPGKYVMISIKDEGTGIPKEHLTRIFDPFFTTKEHGSGLGLATSYSITKRHGGYIEVKSEVGKGSEFIVYLHATEKKEIKKEEIKMAMKESGGRILLMDDDFTIYEVASHMLDMYGFQVDWVESGEKAIAKYNESLLQNSPYDIIIMDLTVPGAMGGAQAVREILSINSNAKVIVSSGYSNDPVMSNYAAYGFKGVIAKPYRIDQIIKVISDVLSQ